MTEPEPEPPVDWVKIGAQRKANFPAMREPALIDARETLIRIARSPMDDDGTPFVRARRFNREKLVAIQDVLVDWVRRNDQLVMEGLDGS